MRARTTGGTKAVGVDIAPAHSVKGRVQVAAWLVFGAVLVAFPLVFSNATVTSIAVFTLVFMAAATAWNGFSGYSGYIALGHAAFFGTGAYVLTILGTDWHMVGGYGVFWLVPLAGVVAAVVALPFGLVALRTRRHTFVVITIAIFFIFQLAAYNLGFTGGTSGILLPLAPFSAANFNQPFYYMALIILVLTIIVSWLVRRSRFGLQLLAIRDDEDRALGLGVKTRRLKLTAFVISAVPIGMVGGLYFDFVGQIYPQFAFDPLFDLSIALMAFLGGLGTIVGPLLGALVLESLQQYLTQTFSSNATYLIAYGVLFLAVILVLPRGVVPGVSAWRERRRTRAAVDRSGELEPAGVGGSGLAGTAR